MTGAGGRIVVMGQCTIDDIYPLEGAPMLGTVGGAAVFAALGAVMSRVPVTLVSVVGRDYPIDDLAAQVRGVRLAVRRTGRASIHDACHFLPDGTRRYDFEDWGALDELTPTPADIPADLGGAGPARVHLTPASVAMQIELAEALVSLGAEVGADTETHFFRACPERLLRLAAMCTYFMPSLEHLELLFGRSGSDSSAWADDIFALGCPWVVVKEGARGARVFDRARLRSIHVGPVPGLAVRDVTGAGDAFCGGFMAGVARGLDPVRAACAGTAAASFIVESTGARLPAHYTPRRFAARYRRVCAGSAVPTRDGERGSDGDEG